VERKLDAWRDTQATVVGLLLKTLGDGRRAAAAFQNVQNVDDQCDKLKTIIERLSLRNKSRDKSCISGLRE